MSLSFARDEFHWLLRHAENVPQKKSAATKAEDYVDRLNVTQYFQSVVFVSCLTNTNTKSNWSQLSYLVANVGLVRTLISVCNQPATQGQLSLPSLQGWQMSTSFGWKAKAGMVHSVSGGTRGVQVKLWDPLRTRAIPERLRGVFTTRRYTNPPLPLPLPYYYRTYIFGKQTTAILEFNFQFPIWWYMSLWRASLYNPTKFCRHVTTHAKVL